VRVDSFPYNEFGELKGTVQSIGSDVLAPDQTYNYFRFPVTVSLDRSSLSYKGHKLKLRSGMSINANVVLRQRPVIAIFTQQVLPFWDNLSKL
jgi:HlyD family secretion protein